MKRISSSDTCLPGKAFLPSKYLLLPVPKSEIALNKVTVLEQNLG